MVDGGPKSSRFTNAEVWALGLAFVGTMLGVGTLIVVYWVMSGFRAAMMAAHPDIVKDPAFMEAMAAEQRVLMVMIALVGLGILLNVAGAIRVFRSRAGRATS